MKTLNINLYIVIVLSLFMLHPLQSYAKRIPAKTRLNTIQKEKTLKLKTIKKHLQKKPTKTNNKGAIWLYGVLGLFGVGLLMLIIGLILKLAPLWIKGICLMGIPFLILLIFFIIFIIGFSTAGDLC